VGAGRALEAVLVAEMLKLALVLNEMPAEHVKLIAAGCDLSPEFRDTGRRGALDGAEAAGDFKGGKALVIGAHLILRATVTLQKLATKKRS
jgi:hypothetical protein